MGSSLPPPASCPSLRWHARMLLAMLLLASSVGAAACGGDDAQARDRPATGTSIGDSEDAAARLPRSRFNNLDTSGLNAIRFDINQDGRDDQVHHRDAAGRPVRIERDLNFDGRIDAWEHYQNGALAEEEIDLDLDGKIDVVRTYQGGVAATKRYAVGFRADMVVLRRYDPQGNLVQVERDTDRDGVVDVWEHYSPGSLSPDRVEVDANRDGVPDRTVSGGS